MKILVAFAFYLFYWLCCFLGTGTGRKNLAGLRSYPDAVQTGRGLKTRRGNYIIIEKAVKAAFYKLHELEISNQIQRRCVSENT